ncbi:MAG: 2,6-dihydroxypyridine 3-monooxygenase [Pseudomonadota bacterium]|jgi:2-polyprenyl-6-methoxyphenol hydroxylase-like FAD-dependent oxidoreductase
MPISSRESRILIIGGSIAGLTLGNLLHRKGFDVHIFERTPGHMEGRGAGITMLPGLIEGLQAAGVDVTEAELGVHLPMRIALGHQGNILAERAFPQTMTTWKRLYDALRGVFPVDRYHDDRTVQRVEQNEARVTAFFTDGTEIQGGLLVAADGLRSAVRTQLMPEVKPVYPGYIAWRCLADESALSSATHATLFNRYAVWFAPGQQGIGYAVPGPDHALVPGKRQYNMVWYQPVPEAGLARLLTDDDGRYHPNGIPPTALSRTVLAEMMAQATDLLPQQIAEVTRVARTRFFQPILDLQSPRLVHGRVVIAGDAAFTARPHVAAGVPKATGDALALAKAIHENRGDYPACLQAFEQTRLRVGRTMVGRGQYLGAYMEAQLKSEAERLAAETARDPERVMLETAAPFDYGEEPVDYNAWN